MNEEINDTKKDCTNKLKVINRMEKQKESGSQEKK